MATAVRHRCSGWLGFRTTTPFIRQSLDGISPESFYGALDVALTVLRQKPGGLKSFRRLGERCLIALDGTEFHRSTNVHCELCSTGEIQYLHGVLSATLVAPGHNRVVPLRPQFIEPQDYAPKQDCEFNALKRWLDDNAAIYQALRPILSLLTVNSPKVPI